MERLQVVFALKRRNRLLRFSVPIPYLYLGAVGLVGLLVLTGFLGQLYLDRHTDHGRMKRLVAENYLLKQKITTYAAAVDTFRNFLASTEEMDNRLRAACGLYLIPDDIRMMGVGGGGDEPVEPQVEELVRRVQFEQRSLDEIETALKDQQERLAHLPSIWPVRGWVTSSFGYRSDPFTGRRNMHDGIDIVAPYGTPVVAPAAGRVVYSGWKSNWGRVVEIDHGNGIHTFFAHLRSTSVEVGATVARGQQIGRLGSSGRSTGAHLHYGVKRKGSWVNPRSYILG
ncbi:M23 family metallopeptidase [candidate division WOR-3 bacterium]|nr:M23 family metallopeptidase [candidate division WOR-3 bacterium]